jgi:hypothetical protein
LRNLGQFGRLLVGDGKCGAGGHTCIDACQLVMVTLRQATSQAEVTHGRGSDGWRLWNHEAATG